MKEHNEVEDYFDDVLSKAMRGQGKGAKRLAAETGLNESIVKKALQGEVDEPHLNALAAGLSLNSRALSALRRMPTAPDVELPASVFFLKTPYPVPGYEEMTVNCYIFCPDADRSTAVVFDTGNHAQAIFSTLKEENRHLSHLFLTHTHPDHIAAYDAIVTDETLVYSPAEEPFRSAKPVYDGDIHKFADVQLRAILTNGHSPGGTTYLLEGLERPIAFVGDAIFCRSAGKVGPAHFVDAMSKIRNRILSLPEETILCPGHGPLTTVGFEKQNNPFFATG